MKSVTGVDFPRHENHEHESQRMRSVDGCDHAKI